MRVRGVVVEDRVDHLGGRHGTFDGGEELDEILMPVVQHTAGGDLALEHVEGRKVCCHLETAAEERSSGVGLEVFAGAGTQIDTTTANGRLALGIFAAFAEFERELIAERTQAGLAAARARGRLGGRPRKMNGRRCKWRWRTPKQWRPKSRGAWG
jgi:Resolvase, N terminal domain